MSQLLSNHRGEINGESWEVMPLTCRTCKGEKYSSRPCTSCDGLALHSCSCGNLNHQCVHCAGGGFEPCVGCNGTGWSRKGREPKAKDARKQPQGRKISATYFRRHQARLKWLTERPGEPMPPEYKLPEEPQYLRDKLAPYDMDSATLDVRNYRASVIAILERHGWNVSKAAKEMGMSREAIYRRIARFQIMVPERERLSKKPIAGVVG